MRRRPNAGASVTLSGALALLVIAACVTGASAIARSVEAELTRVANIILDQHNAEWATVVAKAQVLELTGVAPDAVARQALENALLEAQCSSFGLKVACHAKVNNRVTLQPEPPPPRAYALQVFNKEAGLELKVQVPSVALQAWLASKVNASGPAKLEVEVLEGRSFAPLEPVLSAVLQAAALLQPGRVALDSTGIRVDGAVADAAAEQLLRSALDAVQAPFSVERITLIHRDELDRCNVRLQAILERVPIAFVLFSSEIKRRSKLALTEVADVVKQCPGSLRVEGHTDNVGEPADNVRLSLERAWVVSKALEEAGVESARTQPVGLGETLPIASNHTRKGRTLNRRIELKLVGPVEGQK